MYLYSKCDSYVMPRVRKYVKGSIPSADKKIAQQKKKNGHIFRQIAMNWHGEHKRWVCTLCDNHPAQAGNVCFPGYRDSLIDQITTETLLFTLRKVENKGFLEITARLKNYVTEIMRYAVKKQLIKPGAGSGWRIYPAG
nr:bacteriophage integrase [Salmonella sp. NCTC 7297]